MPEDYEILPADLERAIQYIARNWESYKVLMKDGSVVDGLLFPRAVSGPLTNTELRAADVPVSIAAPVVANQGSPGAAAWPATLIDEHGDPIASIENNNEKYLEVAMIQDVHTDDGNSSAVNLAAGNSYTFTGVGHSTLGVSAIQWNLKTDQNATVYVEQSDDNVNWDLSDSFDYYYSKGGQGQTVLALTAYWRVRVVLKGFTATTFFRLKSFLCPIANPLPRTLNTRDRLNTSSGIIDEESLNRAEVDVIGSLKVETPVRLTGTAFSGTTKDPNFWIEAVTGSGSVAQVGEITLATGATANSTASYTSIKKARKIAGAPNQFRCVVKFGTAVEANNLRRIGPYDVNDGFFFQVNGTVFGVGSRKGTTDTIVNSGSFNGNYGVIVEMDTLVKRLVIDFDHLSTKFYVNGILLHTITGSVASLTNTLDFPVKMENVNSGESTTNHTMAVRFATIARLGNLLSEPFDRYQAGTTAGLVLKYGAGNIHGLAVSGVQNNSAITLYDNVAASGSILWSSGTMPANTTPFSIPLFGVSFSIGLTLVISGANSNVMVAYD